ncbi:MAG: GNAT family N-acetyltransferase [Phycisphaerae bacterium]
MALVQVLQVPIADVLPVRGSVLRQGRPPETWHFPGDADALHFAARVDGQVVGVASLYNDPRRPEEQGQSWRLRGMAVLPDHQQKRLGVRLVTACAAAASEHGATRLWCNARLPAQGFYARLGFDTLGDVFEIPDAGPHVVMQLRMIP